MYAFFSTASSVAIVLVVIIYFKQVVEGDSTPNPATWLIWSAISTMNAVTYFSVVQGNVFKLLTIGFATLGLALIFIYSLFTGKFSKVGKVEIVCLALAFVIGIFWKTTGNAMLTNLLLQVIFVISFLPTINGLLRNKLREKLLPWGIAVISYTLLIIALLIELNNTNWISFAHPIINGILGNGSVAVIIYIKKRKGLI